VIDVNAMRDPAIHLNGLHKADDIYTFYYDETNNIRRFHITENGFNVNQPNCFVLGGIAHKGKRRAVDISGLRTQLRIQNSAKEIKLKHLGKGDFLDLMNASKVSTLFDWLAEEDFLLHYQVLDVVYWSLTDIIDSIVTALDQPQLMAMATNLKNDLYAVLREDQESMVAFLDRYDYPDVTRERRRSFLVELLKMLDARRSMLQPFNYQMLKGVVEMALNAPALPFLEDEDPKILIDEFSMFYINRICLFKNSVHVFDIEKVIEDKLSGVPFYDGDREFKNFEFVDSQIEPGVQIADIVAGILGKAFTYFNQTNQQDLSDAQLNLSTMQSGNIAKLAVLMRQSVEENAGFAHYINSIDDRSRASTFLDI